MGVWDDPSKDSLRKLRRLRHYGMRFNSEEHEYSITTLCPGDSDRSNGCQFYLHKMFNPDLYHVYRGNRSPISTGILGVILESIPGPILI